MTYEFHKYDEWIKEAGSRRNGAKDSIVELRGATV
jgi:hypothetical protein